METPIAYAWTGRMDRIAEVAALNLMPTWSQKSNHYPQLTAVNLILEVMFHVKTYSFSPGRGGIAGNVDSGGEVGYD